MKPFAFLLILQVQIEISLFLIYRHTDDESTIIDSSLCSFFGHIQIPKLGE